MERKNVRPCGTVCRMACGNYREMKNTKEHDEIGFHHEDIHSVCLELICEEEIKENLEL